MNFRRPIFARISLIAVMFTLLSFSSALQAQANTLTLARDDYYDKTLAGILGQVGGFLSGYEFVSAEAMPDDWFRLTYGPYSGDSPYFAVTDFSGYDRLFADGRVGSDDDYHVDFFIQHIFEEYGPNPTFWDMRTEWVKHQVQDWGGGDIAMELMNKGMLPPMTGYAEYNRFYWVSEPYIETETIGMIAPGMLQTARRLTGRFARVVGEFDSVVWGEFWATMYAAAYFETDARDALEKAAVVLPANTYPYEIYQIVKRLHAENPDDWRAAQTQLQAYSRSVYRIDNPLVVADMNNAMGIMAILYGENDYMTTARIASLSGYDADCTAAAVLGVMGIIKGMAGTPEEILTRVYADGKGVYINDTTSGYPPFVMLDYPEEQSWDDLAALYQRNAERQIVAQGGRIEADTYVIVPQTLIADAVILIPNYDFEAGTLEGWQSNSTAGSASVFVEKNTEIRSGANMAHSGNWKGVVQTTDDQGQGALFVMLNNLTPGTTYHISAYVQSDGIAQFFASNLNDGAPLMAAVVTTLGKPEREWVRRDLVFIPQGTQAVVGLSVPPGTPTRAAIDNLFVQQIPSYDVTRYEAEMAVLMGVETENATSASNGQYITGLDETGDTVQFTVTVPIDGEYLISVYYANGDTPVGELRLTVNDMPHATAFFASTGSWGIFSQTRIELPIVLHKGENVITFERRKRGGDVELDAIEITIDPVDMVP